MPANTSPIFSKAPALSTPTTGLQVLLETAMTAATAFTGTDANVVKAFDADATNGSFVQKIRMKAYNTAGAGTTAATVCRVWINNGADNTVATNNTLYTEASLPAVAYSAIGGSVDIDIPIGIALPAGYRLYLGLGTTVGTGMAWAATAVAGNY